MRDKVNQNRCPDLKGEKHPRAKLTNAEVRALKRLHACGGFTNTQLANIFGVNRGSVSLIVNGKEWTHI